MDEVADAGLGRSSSEVPPRDLFYPRIPKNIHIERLSKRFGGLKAPGSRLPEDMKYVFLCFTNRCGSNYFAELLASGGPYNIATETLNWDVVCGIADRLEQRSFHQYFSWLAAKRSRSGILFLKVALSQIELLGHAGIMEQILPQTKFILIERSDKLAQAISHVIAFATKQFVSGMAPEMEAADVEFSAAKIDIVLRSLARSYSSFDLFFAHNGIVPVQVIYEQLVADTVPYMSLIARQLNLPDFQVDPSKVKLERQAGAVNTAWRERFLAADRAA